MCNALHTVMLKLCYISSILTMLHFSYYLIMLNTTMTQKIILFDCLHHMVEDPVLTSLLKKTGCATSCASRSAEIREYVCEGDAKFGLFHGGARKICCQV